MSSMAFSLMGAAVAGPGLGDWSDFRQRLAGRGPSAETAWPTTGLLSARERRRAPATVRLALGVAESACRQAGVDPKHTRAVFASGMGDVEITVYMCQTLAEAPELLSPTRFHNSVHNAASGYWSIATGASGDITAVSAHYDSPRQGLIEALMRLVEAPEPVLLVSYDLATLESIRDAWPTRQPFAGAAVVGPAEVETSLARLEARPVDRRGEHTRLPENLDRLIADNPAAGLLDLLVLATPEAPAGPRFMGGGGRHGGQAGAGALEIRRS